MLIKLYSPIVLLPLPPLTHFYTAKDDQKWWCVIVRNTRSRIVNCVCLRSPAMEEERREKGEERGGGWQRDTARNGRVASSRLTIGASSVCFVPYGSSLLTAQLLVRRALDRRRHCPVRGTLTRNTRNLAARERGRRENVTRMMDEMRTRNGRRDRDANTTTMTTMHLPPRAIARKCCCAASATVLCFDARRRAHVNCSPSRPITSRRGVNVYIARVSLDVAYVYTYVNFCGVSRTAKRKLLTVAQYCHTCRRARARNRILPLHLKGITMSFSPYAWNGDVEQTRFFLVRNSRVILFLP